MNAEDDVISQHLNVGDRMLNVIHTLRCLAA